MRIDVHAHYFPAPYIDFLVRHGLESRARGAWMAPGARITLEERLALLDAVGIDLQVLSLSAATPYSLPEAAAAEAARLANDLYVDLCHRYPGRYAVFATVPLPYVDAALRELERVLALPEVVGVTLGCSIAGQPLDDPAFAPFFAELDRRGTVLFLHPQGVDAGLGTADYGLTWLVGATFEDTVTTLRLVFSGWLQRYPRIRTIVPHLGGPLPFLKQRVDDLWAAGQVREQGHEPPPEALPSRQYRQLYFDTVNSHPPALRCACETFGADRLLLGTDFPYLVGPRWPRLVQYIEEAGLSPEETAAILGGNAEVLLGLPAR
ncbi:MAG TPA: amidohydrolase family protein [Chloroflexota bacterium]|nr:amidohydrolase family protein [Chloroflexota bacterium]